MTGQNPVTFVLFFYAAMETGIVAENREVQVSDDEEVER